jgi:hypothetical protein
MREFRWLVDVLNYIYDMGQRNTDLVLENERLRIALHDAIRRPLGVTPDTAMEFYNPALAFEREQLRREACSGRPPLFSSSLRSHDAKAH